MPDKDNIKPSNIKVIEEKILTKRLKSLVDEKNLIIEKVTMEKADMEAENLKLKNEIRQKDLEIKNLINENAVNEETYKKTNNVNKEIIRDLQEQLEVKSNNKDPDTKPIGGVKRSIIKPKKDIIHENIKLQEILDIESKLRRKELRLEEVDSEVNKLNKLLVSQQRERILATTELNLVKGKIKKSFTAADMSDYLNSAIDSFNSEVNTVDSSVNYVINEMDIDLKAQVYMDEQDGMRLSSADIGSDSANNLSSIKFSIRAIPKL